MRLIVLLLPVLFLLVFLGFVMSQVGENKDKATRSRSAILRIVQELIEGKIGEPQHEST
jgi:uncharacterized membrane protein